MKALLLVVFAAVFAAPAFAGSNNFDDQGLLPFPLINAAVLSGPAVTSSVVDARHLSNIGVQVNVGSSSPAAVGLFLVDVSEDYSANPANAGKWTTLNFASQAATYSNMVVPPTGTAAAVFYSATAGAVYYRDIFQTSAPYMRVRWVPTTTSGGVFSVYMSGK